MSEELKNVFKALGNKIRLDIVRSVLLKREVSCRELLEKFPLSQPTMSHHFNLLLQSKILLMRKDGTRHYYKINTDKLHALGINLAKLKS